MQFLMTPTGPVEIPADLIGGDGTHEQLAAWEAEQLKPTKKAAAPALPSAPAPSPSAPTSSGKE